MTLLMVLSDSLVESRQLLDYLNAMADIDARVVLLRVSPSGREASLETSHRVLEQARHALSFAPVEREIATRLEIGDPEAIVNTLGLAQTSDEGAIAAAVDEVIKANPKVIADYRKGNERALDGLIGPVMGRMKGKASGAVIRRIILERSAERP